MADEYGLFLSFNNYEDVFRLPVNPETLEIKEAGDGKSYSIIDLGEINVISYPKLTEISFDSLFPAQYYPFVVYGKKDAGQLWKPYEYVEMIKKWMNSRRPVRLVCTGLQSVAQTAGQSGGATAQQSEASLGQTAVDEIGLNMAVSIESFSWKLSAGNTGDIEYSLGLKRYVFYQALAVKVNGGEVTAQTKRASDKASASTYTIKAGDTLWGIARKELGDGSKYKTLQQLNGISDSELKKLAIGRVIRLS